VDRRRIGLATVLAAVAALLLLALAHRASLAPGEPIRAIQPRFWALVAGMAGFCGFWGESMRQLSLTRRGDPGAPGSGEGGTPLR
jgi:Spy/CpxP family protein refolding chaperone